MKKFEDINELLELGEIIPIFQPIKNLKNGLIYKYEALCRVNYENKVYNPFSLFGEDHDESIYKKITKGMLPKVLESMNGNTFEVSLNLTKYDILDSKMLKYIENLLIESSNSQRVILEIIEGSEFSDLDSLSKIINNFKKNTNCKFALDDFGKGFSNIVYLSNVEFDYIKLDGSIIREMDKDIKRELIVGKLTELFQRLNSKVIAEFVENKKVENLLKELKINYGQGFLYPKASEILK